MSVIYRYISVAGYFSWAFGAIIQYICGLEFALSAIKRRQIP